MRRDFATVLLLLLAAACGARRAHGPKLVLLVSVDTLRADRLGGYGSDLGLTPRLDALAAKSTVFERAYAPAPFTVPSLSCVLTGRHPEQLGIRVNESVLVATVPTLAESMRKGGFRTGAVVSNFVLRRGTGLERGFERYDDRMPEAESARKLPERTAPDTTAAALAMLDELRAGDAAVFLWVHYQDPHGPYTPPKELLPACVERERAKPDGRTHVPFSKDFLGIGGIPTYQRIGDEDEAGYYRGAYDAEVKNADEHIGRLLDGVTSRGLLDGALVVFLADHGESLGEDDYWFAHGEYLSDCLVHVPLLVASPGRVPMRRKDVVGLVDVVPTILGTVGLRAPEGAIGRDVFGTGPGESSAVFLSTAGGATVPRMGLIRGDDKFVIEAAAKGRQLQQHLYRLGDESRDRAGAEGALLAKMAAEVKELRLKMGSEGEAARRELTPDDRERMKKLGYAGDEPAPR